MVSLYELLRAIDTPSLAASPWQKKKKERYASDQASSTRPAPILARFPEPWVCKSRPASSTTEVYAVLAMGSD
jgi:hypothetical protein